MKILEDSSLFSLLCSCTDVSQTLLTNLQIKKVITEALSVKIVCN